MRRFVIPVIFSAATLCVVTHAVTAAPETRPASTRPATTLPTEADLRTKFEDGDYAGTLEQIHRVLARRGAAVAAYDRYELITLKAECHLRLKQFRSASDAYQAAAKLTDDKLKAATARSINLAIMDAKGTTVRLRQPAAAGKPATNADLLDPGQRREAFRIVRANLRTAAEPKIDAARRAEELKPILEAIDIFSPLNDLEVAAESILGEDAALQKTLVKRGRELVERKLTAIEADIIGIDAAASEVVGERVRTNMAPTKFTNRQGQQFVPVRKGLTQRDQTDLRTMIKMCDGLSSTVTALAKADGAEAGDADGLVKKVKSTRAGAIRVLEARY